MHRIAPLLRPVTAGILALSALSPGASAQTLETIAEIPGGTFRGLAVDDQGNLFAANAYTHTVARIDIERVAMRVSVSPAMLGGGAECWVSAPEQKPLPVPVRTTTPVSLS